jgi:hypothetical protein
MKRSGWVVLAGAVAVTRPAHGQVPDTFTNLQVLPKDTAKADLVRTMRGWATDLNVRCNHCHVGPDNLQGMDFAVDTKPTKRAAREMLRMLQAVNLAVKGLPPRDEPRDGVTCYSCHRRQAVPPRPMPDELMRAAQTGGGAAAVARYRELRQAHPTDGAYDVGPGALLLTTNRLLEAGRLDDGIAIAREGTSQFPDAANLHAVLGDALLRKGDRAAAAESYRKALTLEPGHFMATRGLKEAQGPGPSPSPR